MLKTLRLYAVVSALAFLTVHCSKDKEEDPDPVVEESVCYTIQEVFTNPSNGITSTRELVYDGERLLTINETMNLPTPTTTNIVAEYDGYDRVARTVFLQNGREVQYYTFEYDNQNLLRKINWFTDYQRNGTLGLHSARELDYNALKQVVSVKNYLLLNQSPLLINDITYTYDANGNVIRSREYRANSSREMEVLSDIVVNVRLTYDDKVNPHNRIPYLLYTYPASMGATFSKNNSVTQISETTLEDTQVGPGNVNVNIFNFSRSYTHTYANNGWPVTRTEADGTSTTYAYLCE